MELFSSNIRNIQEAETESFLYFEKWNFSVHPDKISNATGNENYNEIS